MIEIIKLSIFVLVSIGIIVFSWDSLQRIRNHGFFRFFVFEAILALILFNANYWFEDPFSPLQIVSWVLLCGAIAMALHGFYLLKKTGKPQGNIENTSVIVKVGAYKYIRHPLYCSLLLLALGAFFKQVSLISGIILVIALVFLFITARVEEHENIERFGTGYGNYLKLTRMFVPFVF
jgi:protein-S-isoprenylcysteine O-methyltransferase Ste14